MFSFITKSGGGGGGASEAGAAIPIVGDETLRMPIYPLPNQLRQQREIRAQRLSWNDFLEKNPLDGDDSWLWQYWRADSRVDNQFQKKIMGLFNSKVKLQKTMKGLIRNGIPPELRGLVWYTCSGAEQKRNAAAPEEQYNALLARIGSLDGTDVGHDIDKDLLRTFPTHAWLHSEEGLGCLRRILSAYALRNPRVGYCQSMNYLAAMLMFHMSDEKAFWVLCSIIEDMLAPNYYDPNMVGSRVDQHVFQVLIKRKLPAVHKVLLEKQTNLDPITCPWFLCMYINILPFYTVCRVWDSFMWEGNLILFRMGLAMLHSKIDILSDSGADTMSIYMALKIGQGGPRLGSFELADHDIDENISDAGPSSTQLLLQNAFNKSILGNIARQYLERKRSKYLAIILAKDEENRAKTAAFLEEEKAKEQRNSQRILLDGKIAANKAQSKRTSILAALDTIDPAMLRELVKNFDHLNDEDQGDDDDDGDDDDERQSEL